MILHDISIFFIHGQIVIQKHFRPGEYEHTKDFYTDTNILSMYNTVLNHVSWKYLCVYLGYYTAKVYGHSIRVLTEIIKDLDSVVMQKRIHKDPSSIYMGKITTYENLLTLLRNVI